MKIMAFVGSPRKGSNVDILIDKVIEGARSKADVDVEKIYLYELNIKYCNACMLCTPLHGNKDCPIEDDMVGIYKRMQEVDGFIFGSPNHGHTITAAMTNLFSRMQAMMKMHIETDDSGKLLSAESRPLIKGKKAVAVVSQGDFTPSCSGLLLRVLDSNIKDFKLKKTGEVLSTGNLMKGAVKDKLDDLNRAFTEGVRLVG